MNMMQVRMQVLQRCLFFLLGLSMASTVFAGPGAEDFESGIKASDKGDYASALTSFKKAKKAGMNTAALKYNLAVSYYKLKKYEAARKIFTVLADVPTFEQRAYFNLGLIANKQKDEAAAIRWFRRSYRNLSDPKIRKLSAIALKRLGSSVRQARRFPQQWVGFVSSSLYYDSNVTLLNEDPIDGTSNSDTAVDISVSSGRWLKGTMNSGVRMALGANMKKFSTLSQYDDSQLSARVLRYDRLGDWKMRLGGSWDEIYFDGRGYQRIVSADVRGLKTLSENNQLRLRYKLSRIQATDSVYDYLDGWRQQFRVGLQQNSESDKTRYYYQLELNDREDSVRLPTSDRPFTSYSPTRHTLRATHWRELLGRWRLRLDARVRYSDYNDANLRGVAPNDQKEHREDSQLRLSARISRKFDRRWEVYAQYTATTNDSTIDGIDESKSYDRSIIKAGVSWAF